MQRNTEHENMKIVEIVEIVDSLFGETALKGN